MSGRRRRQVREAAQRLALIPACSCGYWPHSPSCRFLSFIASIKGWCTQCGYRIQRRRSGWWHKWWCPNGCEHGLDMIYPKERG
jgi:hypothetical protein